MDLRGNIKSWLSCQATVQPLFLAGGQQWLNLGSSKLEDNEVQPPTKTLFTFSIPQTHGFQNFSPCFIFCLVDLYLSKITFPAILLSPWQSMLFLVVTVLFFISRWGELQPFPNSFLLPLFQTPYTTLAPWSSVFLWCQAFYRTLLCD